MESPQRQPWNKGKLVGQKAPLKRRDIWAIRIRLQLRHRTRDLALFNLAIDSKLRACDLVKLRVVDVAHGGRVATRAVIMQQKTKRPVQFEITDLTRRVGRGSTSAPRYFFVPKPRERFSAPFHSGVREDRSRLGCGDRLGWCGIRHPLDAAHEAIIDIPKDQEPARGTTAARACQARKYRPPSRDRGGRRIGNGGADRSLTHGRPGRGHRRGPANSGRTAT